jgi:hypothetical protein
MSLASAIAATVQRITLEARVDGRAMSGVIEASVSMGFDQANAQATIYCRTRPSWAEETKSVELWAGYNGETALIFRGELSGFAWEDGPGRVGLDCRDLLARTRLEWQGETVEETEIDSAAMVRHILEIYGIPSSVAHIEGSGWVLGTIFPVTLKKGDTGLALIQRIDALEGYRTFTDSAGVIRRMRVSGNPGASGAFSITTAQLIDRPKRVRTLDGIVNACIVTGLTYEGLTVGGEGVAEAQAPNPYVPSPPGFVGPPVQDDLIEDDATALAIARREVSDKNRRPEGLELTIVGDPRMQPAMTLTVTESTLETGTANVFVEHVAHQIGATFTTTLKTTGGNLSGFVAGVPVAIFDVKTVLEGEDTDSGVAGLIVGVADGSQSYDPDGTIASYSWAISATGATPDPTTGSGPIQRFTVPSTATDLTIALTVTDGDGLDNTVSRTIPIDTSTMLVEDLYTAEGSIVACSSDGEQTWREQTPASGNATCLAAFAPSWGQIWGTDSGHIYATFDKLLSTLVDLGQPAGDAACTAVFAHEQDDTRLWAAFSDGQVYFGEVDTTAQTIAWTLQGIIPAGPIREIRESYGTFGELRATAGAGYYYSADAGNSWSLIHIFDTAWRMAAGFDTNLASGLNDAAPLYDEDGVPPTLPSGVEHIRGLSFGWRQQELYAADDAAQLYLGSGPTFDLSLHADSAPAGVNHMIRSGNIDRVVYMAVGDGTGLNGFAKWIPDTKAPFMIRRTGSRSGAMIGYGPLHAPDRLAYTILMLPQGASGDADKLFITRDGGVLWTGKALPAANKSDWLFLKANPFNPNQLLLYRAAFAGSDDNALYYSPDFGDTWTTIYTNLTTTSQFNQSIYWSPDAATAWVGVRSSAGGHGYAQRGTGTSYTEIDLGTDEPYNATPGQAGEIIYVDATGAQGYVDSADGLHLVSAPSTLPAGFSFTQRATRKAAHVRESAEAAIKVTTDYHTGAWTTIPSSNGRAWLAVLADDTIICGGQLTGQGVIEIADAWGTPVISNPAYNGISIGAVASDAQTQRVAAAVYDPVHPSSLQPAVRNPLTGLWTLIPRPPDATTLANRIEVTIQ